MGRARQFLRDLGAVAAYLGLAWLSTRFAVLDNLTVWYAPAGLALGLGVVRGWRALPAMAVGEVLVGLLLFGVADDLGWLVVPNGVLYATVYVGFGRLVDTGDAALSDPARRDPLPLVTIAVAATVSAALVGVAFHVMAGATAGAAVPRALLVWWLGDIVGVAGVGVTVVTIAIQLRRGARWWAVPGKDPARTVALVALPAALTLAVATLTDGLAPFATAVFLPTVLVAVRGGVPGVALAAPLTSFVMTMVGNATFGTDVLGLTDLQFVLFLLLVTGFGLAFVIEERRQLQRQLRIREHHLVQAQRQARAGSFRWDVPDDRVEWSDGLFALFGTDRQPVTSMDYLDRVHPDDRARVAEAISTALETGTPHEHVYRVVRADGDVLTVRARLRAHAVDGRVTELIGTCTDVSLEEETRRHLADAVTAEHAARMAEAEARVAIARTERIKDALLVAVSHEVRTPLTVLQGLVETLRRPEIAEDRLSDHAGLLERLQHSTERLRRVLRDLLDVDRIGRGVVEPVRRPCDLQALAGEVVAALDPEDHEVLVDLPTGEVELDARLVARMLEQLLANAMRHGDDGTPIRVTGAVSADTLRLQVDDEGPGIDAADRDRVFGAFEHGDVPAHSPGSGVGLYLVARFAELHGGRAWVTEADDGRGASFRVELPLTQPATAG